MLLSAKIDFGRVLKSKPINKDHLFKVYAIQNNLKKARLGISLHKDTVKKATTTSKLQRTIGNSLEALSALSADIVFVYISNDEPYDAKIVRESLEHHKNKIKEKKNSLQVFPCTHSKVQEYGR